MLHEKIIKRPDGSSVKITVSAHIPGRFNDEKVIYNHGIYTRGYRKKKWIGTNKDGVVTRQEIYLAELEFWKKIMPSPRGNKPKFVGDIPPISGRRLATIVFDAPEQAKKDKEVRITSVPTWDRLNGKPGDIPVVKMEMSEEEMALDKEIQEFINNIGK